MPARPRKMKESPNLPAYEDVPSDFSGLPAGAIQRLQIIVLIEPIQRKSITGGKKIA